jgi:hypothetical protein
VIVVVKDSAAPTSSSNQDKGEKRDRERERAKERQRDSRVVPNGEKEKEGVIMRRAS